MAAGAEFVQTQYVFDVDVFARWMTGVRALGLPGRCKIIAGVSMKVAPQHPVNAYARKIVLIDITG